MRRVVLVVLGLLLAVAVLPFLPAAPAGAVADAPVLVFPANDPPQALGSNPVFEWQESPTAVRYVLQVSASPSMSPLISGGSITTTNLRGTFTSELPAGDLYWRVAAYDTPSGGTPAYSEIRTFTKATIAAPTLTTPSSGATLVYPTSPPTFTWTAVPGAKSYELVIANDSEFTPPLLVSETTENTSFTLDEPLPLGQTGQNPPDYFWRVRAKNSSNATGDWAAFQAFKYVWDQAPTPLSPGVAASSIPPNVLPKVEQVAFNWTAIAGAVEYELWYDNNAQFAAPTKVTVTSTTYSPPTTVNNGSYFWKVRGLSSIDGPGNWSDVFTFERAWPAANGGAGDLGAVTLIAPTNNSLTVREPNFYWTPQRLGSRYQIQISEDANFSSGVLTATTTATSYTPYPNTWNPNPGTTYYWRVRALDDPLPVNGRFTDQGSPPWKFIYFPEIVTQTAPANGASSIAPRLEWSRSSSPLIGEYRIKVFDADGNLKKQVNTFNNSYVPTGLDPADNPHRWKVITRDADGRYGPEPDSYRTFNVLAPTVAELTPTPERTSPANPSSDHVPPLAWSPVTTDGSYTVKYSTTGSDIYFVLAEDLTTPGYVHNTDSIPPGTYDWWAEAYDKDGNYISEGVKSTFTVTTLANSVAVSPEHCPPNAACNKLFGTPTMDWEPVTGATKYQLVVALDVNFTNVFATYETQYTQLTPRESYPDNQAGQAYYWYARPCYGGICGTQPANFAGQPGTPVRAFQKIAKPVPQISPAPGATVSTNAVTFSWGGFLQTNCSPGARPNAVPPVAAADFRCNPADPRMAPVYATQEARSYIVEVSDRIDFATKVDTSPKVDQTTYTAYNKTYPEGQLYWRVIIVDGSQNLLTAPVPTSFTKASPLVGLNLPAANATVTATPTLSVTPKPFEAAYEFEVYKNPGQPLTVGNRVFTRKVEAAATTPTSPLPAGQYGWRVRRYDADNRAGAWSAEDNSQLRLFTVAGTATNLQNPANNATVDPNRIIFDWSVVNQAVQYRVETNVNANFIGANTESQTTVMNAWAPRSEYAPGFYYWRVHTLDSDGNVVATSSVRGFSAGAAGSKYVSISPSRVLDSRGPVGGWGTRLGPNQSRALKVAGGTLPAPISATAVVLNVTAVESTAQSFMTLYPSGSPRPTAGSNLNYLQGQIIPNLVTVKVGTNGNIDIYNAAGSVNVVADMVGYYDKTSGDQYNSITPARLLDSRSAPQWASPNPSGVLGQGQTKAVQVTGVGGVPATAKAAIVNITVTDGTAQSFLMAYPAGSPQPAQASNLNFLAGQIIPNLAIVKIGTGGKINLFNAQGTVNVIVDVVGYFDTGVGKFFHELEPNRILDTRVGNGLTSAFTNNQARDLQVSGRGGVPEGASAVVMNVTAVEGSALSYLTVYPDGVSRPTSSNLNFFPGQIIPNLVTVGLSASTGKATIYNNSGTVNVLADVVGYYADY